MAGCLVCNINFVPLSQNSPEPTSDERQETNSKKHDDTICKNAPYNGGISLHVTYYPKYFGGR